MSITTQLTHSAETWQYLKGMVSLYKPADYPVGSLVKMLKHRLAADLNCMQRSSESEPHLLTDGDGGVVTSSGREVMERGGGEVQDYSSHPAVLGPGYDPEDIKTRVVNPLGQKSSGVLLVGINSSGIREAQALRSAKLMRTYHIRGEFGRATTTGWAGGRTVKCEGWTGAVSRPWMIQQMLANISSANQARAWAVSEVGADTQEGYELALKGPVRPKLPSETLVYNIKLKELQAPLFLLELHSIDSQSDRDQQHLVDLVAEVGLKCKTVCHVHSVRCGALGPWTADTTLLPKELTLQNILNNISQNRRLYRQYISQAGGLHKSNIKYKPTPREKTVVDIIEPQSDSL